MSKGVDRSEMAVEMGLFRLTMADAVVGIRDKGESTLVIANTGVAPVLLEEGVIARSLQTLCNRTIMKLLMRRPKESAVQPPNKDDQQVE